VEEQLGGVVGEFASPAVVAKGVQLAGQGIRLGVNALGGVADVAKGTGALTDVAKGADALGDAAAHRAYLNEKFGRTGGINTDINIRGRQEVAENYFRSKGISEADANAYMQGIDFTQPVEVQALGYGKNLWQFQTPGAPQGKWYSFTPDVAPTELGISPYGLNRITQSVEPKILNNYQTSQPVTVLRSTSAPVDDYWSVSGQTYPTSGGARQIFSPDTPSFVLPSN
jgi:hypothetical protein